MSKGNQIQLICENRTKFGKQNKSLRKSGFVPAVIYGDGKEAISIVVSEKDFSKAFHESGETSIVECVLGDQKISTLVLDVSIHPVRDSVVHVDFRRVNLTKKVTVAVPVEIVGESMAVRSLGGVLLQQMSEIEVESLPQNIPSDIKVDISVLSEIGNEIKVGDIPKSEEFEILENQDRVIVSVIAHKEESTEAQIERSEVEITTSKVDEEGEEGAVEGEQSKEEASAEQAPKTTK